LLFDANLLRIVRRVTPSENDYGFVEFGAKAKSLQQKMRRPKPTSFRFAE
jgi:hypothetical protein